MDDGPTISVKLKDGGRITTTVATFSSIAHLPYYNDIVLLKCTGNNGSALPDPLPKDLQMLIVSGNRLSHLPRDLPATLTCIDARNNILTTLPNVSKLPLLEVLLLADNNIAHISHVDLPAALKTLNLANNILSLFSVATWPEHLLELNLHQNRLTEIDPSFDKLHTGCFVNIGFNDLPAQKHNAYTLWFNVGDTQEQCKAKTDIIRRHERFGVTIRCKTETLEPTGLMAINYRDHADVRTFTVPMRPERTPGGTSRCLADNAQNVHASSIQQSANTSVAWLLTQGPIDPDAVRKLKRAWRPRFWQVKRLFQTWTANGALDASVSSQTIHSVHGITYRELIQHMWCVIERHSARDEILNVLKTEVLDGMSVCFTGRFTRTLNALNGFVDQVSLGISSREQAGNRIVQALKKCKMQHGEDTDEYRVDARKAVKQILEECEIPGAEHSAYLDAI